LIEARGWKDICKVVGVKDKRTAKRILKNLGLLCYDHGIPVLNIACFYTKSAERHMAPDSPLRGRRDDILPEPDA
jgi:hypothetical protein